MSPGQIIDHIWELPWYKVALIAIVDGFILMCKLWPLIAFIVVGALLSMYALTLSKKRNQGGRSETETAGEKV